MVTQETLKYIKGVSMDEFDHAFHAHISFEPGLNIISGVNGTGKTTILKKIKTEIDKESVDAPPDAQILVFSPKRNAEKKNTEAALQYIRSQNRRLKAVSDEAIARALQDDTFETYEPLGHLFIYEYEEGCRGGNRKQIDVMREVTRDYNKVIASIFPEYRLVTEWSSELGAPEIKLETRYGVPLELSVLSSGESAVLALIFNIQMSAKDADVVLIDEPEIHLNWSLEKGLFSFLDSFARSEQKQVIVTTHSRIIYHKDFRPKTQFLVFQDRKVVVRQEPPAEYLEEIAGEAAAIVSTAAPAQKTFFVEDDFHKLMIESLLAIHKKEAVIVIMSDASGAIEKLYSLIRSNDELNENWVNAYMMIDGDGKTETYKADHHFIHLQRHEAESYFFEMDSLAETLDKTTEELQKEIHGLLLSSKPSLGGKHEELLLRLLAHLEPHEVDLDLMSLIDCSAILKRLLKANKKKLPDFVGSYLEALKANGLAEMVLDKKLIEAIQAGSQ